MFKRIGNTLKPHIGSLHFRSSNPPRYVGLNCVTLGVAGAALWYFNAQDVYNDAAGPSMAPAKQKFQAPRITGTQSDPNTIYSLTWGSNRSVF
jgi:hypothetical protein